MSATELYIGVMSGTSLDGIDVVLVSIQSGKITCLHSYCHPMPPAVKSQVLQMNHNAPLNLIQIGELDNLLGHLFAEAIQAFLDIYALEPHRITAIGNHGQTVFHHPAGAHPFTMQLGDANIIAIKTGITTIADFRRKDMALGGQGAPLVPAFHRAIFQHSDSTLIILNIGGIANLSIMQPNQPVYGYDTGPGNGLLDAWCQKIKDQPFDMNGEFAAQGLVNPSFLTQLLHDDYFRKCPPKSTGREHFNLEWLMRHRNQFGHPVTDEDVQATLLELTVKTITTEVARYRAGPHPTLLVCGGGAKNQLLMTKLSQTLPAWEVTDTDSKGISGDYMEAMAFAWLAYCRIHAIPSNLPEVTGASRSTPLGIIYYAD